MAARRSPAQLREAVAVLLANLAHPRPAVILLDDIHLADASSWEALGCLARTLAEVPSWCWPAPGWTSWSNGRSAGTRCSGWSRRAR